MNLQLLTFWSCCLTNYICLAMLLKFETRFIFVDLLDVLDLDQTLPPVPPILALCSRKLAASSGSLTSVHSSLLDVQLCNM